MIEKSKINQGKIIKWLIENKIICIVIVIAFILRIIAMLQLGVGYTLESDDLSYVISGIEFKNTHTITMHESISAQIMPGMPILIGFVSTIFGEGQLLWLALKIIWILMGCTSILMAYKCVTLFAPKWCGIIAALFFIRPDFIWMDNIILTETPYMLCLLSMIYATFMMGKTKQKRYFWMCLSLYMSALMFKANVGIYPVFAAIYLLLVKYDFKMLIKQGIVIGIVLLTFIIPWTIRNYKLYDAIIPLTYGAGNPKLLGTYQGIGYPLDENLDYVTNVDKVVKDKYSKYYDEDGTIKEPHIRKYVELEADGIKAEYRLKEWKKDNIINVIYSYLVMKPMQMIKSSFYWHEVFGINGLVLQIFNSIEWIVCILGIFTTFMLRKRIPEITFLIVSYLGSMFIYAVTFAFDRYAATLTPLRFICIGMSLDLIYKLWKEGKRI